MRQRWNEITELLRQARAGLPSQHASGGFSSIPVSLLTGTLDEFEEFLSHNELELAWDALAAVAERTGASTDCWRKLARAASLMQLADKEAVAAQRATLPITCDRALAIARPDAEQAYRDLSPFKVTIFLEGDGWHIDFDLRDPRVHGGGPHYVIDAVTGTILSKRYEQ